MGKSQHAVIVLLVMVSAAVMLGFFRKQQAYGLTGSEDLKNVGNTSNQFADDGLDHNIESEKQGQSAVTFVKASSLRMNCSSQIIQDCQYGCKWCNNMCREDNDNTCEPFIVFRGFVGGLGNRLWMFISATGVARDNGARLVVSDDFQMIADVFEVEHMNITRSSKDVVVQDIVVYNADAKRRFNQYWILNISNNTELVGYMQNPQYFAKSNDEFATKFDLRFRPSLLDEASNMLRLYGRCDNSSIVKKWVGVHFRRFPDRHKIEPPPEPYAVVKHVNALLELCQSTFSVLTHQNVTCGNETLSTCCALVFSNDPPWVRENLKDIACARFVENEFLNDPALGLPERHNGWATHFGRDMAAMTMCEYLVLTVGTFGYFAGILHGKQPHENGTVYLYSQSLAAKDKFYPSTWQLW